MLDSESQLREAIQKMLNPKAAPAAPDEHAEHTAVADTAPVDNSTSFICPMPEHISIKYQHPGKCPICGMGLVPVRNDMLAKLQPGGKIDHYTCPMPEHADVHVPKPGKCPRCGMTLIPVTISPAPPSAPESATPFPASLPAIEHHH